MEIGDASGFAAQYCPVGDIAKNGRKVFETRRDARLYIYVVLNNLRRAGMHVSTGRQIS
jgi:hypothetical protein